MHHSHNAKRARQSLRDRALAAIDKDIARELREYPHLAAAFSHAMHRCSRQNDRRRAKLYPHLRASFIACAARP